MSKNFNHTLSQKEKEDLLNSGKETYKKVGHRFNKIIAGKQVCVGCGLLALRNKATDWCIEKGCMFDCHPQYEQAMKRLAKCPK